MVPERVLGVGAEDGCLGKTSGQWSEAHGRTVTEQMPDDGSVGDRRVAIERQSLDRRLESGDILG